MKRQKFAHKARGADAAEPFDTAEEASCLVVGTDSQSFAVGANHSGQARLKPYCPAC